MKAYARGYRNTIGDSMLVMVDGEGIQSPSGTTRPTRWKWPCPYPIRARGSGLWASLGMYGANAFMGVINVITSKGNPNSSTLSANLYGGSFSQKG